MPIQQRQYLHAMGIDVWLFRDKSEADETAVPDAVVEKTGAAGTALDDLAREVATCQQCSLHRTRTQTVFGVGYPRADWLIIGEAPGADEDRQGEPFVGRAGKLLNEMLLAIGLSREQVYIANILKCRPPNNRDPKPEEVVACSSYLRRQIEFIQPVLILALGRVAAQNLLQVDTPIGKMRGQRYQYPGTELPVFVTYHPAYLLRSPREKRKVWEDIKIARRAYEELS